MSQLKDYPFSDVEVKNILVFKNSDLLWIDLEHIRVTVQKNAFEVIIGLTLVSTNELPR